MPPVRPADSGAHLPGTRRGMHAACRCRADPTGQGIDGAGFSSRERLQAGHLPGSPSVRRRSRGRAVTALTDVLQFLGAAAMDTRSEMRCTWLWPPPGSRYTGHWPTRAPMPSDSPLLLLPRLRERLHHYRPDPGRVDAAVLVAITDAAVPELILTRRASHMNSHAGEVAFPGGKRDASDRSVDATALRESREEIGLPEHLVEIVGRLDTFTSRVGMRVQPIVGLVPPNTPLTPNPDEIESIFHVPLEFFLTEKPVYTHRFRFMGQDVLVPSFNFGDYVIWGLTAFMIVDLMQRVYEHKIEFEWPTPVTSLLTHHNL